MLNDFFVQQSAWDYFIEHCVKDQNVIVIATCRLVKNLYTKQIVQQMIQLSGL